MFQRVRSWDPYCPSYCKIKFSFFENRPFYVITPSIMFSFYVFGLDLDGVEGNLDQNLLKLCEWLCENCIFKAWINVTCGEEFKASDLEAVIGIEVRNKLNFEHHIKLLWNKASQTLGTLHTISSLFDTKETSCISLNSKNASLLELTCLDILPKKIELFSEQRTICIITYLYCMQLCKKDWRDQ